MGVTLGTSRSLKNPFVRAPCLTRRAAARGADEHAEPPPLPACICVAAGAQVDGIEASIAPRDRGDLVGQRHTFDTGGNGLD